MMSKNPSNFKLKNIRKNDGSIYNLIVKLYPICRSITGEGVRQTLAIINKIIPLEIREIPTGTKVFDWEIPKEWNIKDAYVKNSKGKKIVDFKKSNIHVLNYSTPIHKKLGLDELKDHLFTLPDYPNWIPYLTSYYKENWGFCLTYKQYLQLKKKEEYEVLIDSTIKNGFLTFGEFHINGKLKDEVLFSTYICHPSLCNDNLTGIALTTFLAKYLLKFKTKYSYRFLFIPETIGSITWLALNEKNLDKIKHGLVVTCVGDRGNFTYKKSRQGDALIDKVVEQVLTESGKPFTIVDFFPLGSDERQFCSPAFNLPVGSLTRTPYAKFPEYHTSADNLHFINAQSLDESFQRYLQVIFILENNKTYINLNPKAEPQLGRRGLYQLVGGQKNIEATQQAFLWVLNFSDGNHSLLEISAKSKLPFGTIKTATDLLASKKLLVEIKK